MCECVTYKAKFVSYVCLLACQAVVSIACVVYWIAFIFIEEVFDIYPLYLCLTFFVVLVGYLSWGIPYKIERNGNAFNFFLLGRKAKFSFGKNEFLKYRKGIIMGRVFYFKKKYRSYMVLEELYPEVVKIMEELYLDKPCDPVCKNVPANKVRCSKCGELYESDMSKCLWCDTPNPECGRKKISI